MTKSPKVSYEEKDITCPHCGEEFNQDISYEVQAVRKDTLEAVKTETKKEIKWALVAVKRKQLPEAMGYVAALNQVLSLISGMKKEL